MYAAGVKEKKDRFNLEILFWLDISTDGMVWGVYLTAGISWPVHHGGLQ